MHIYTASAPILSIRPRPATYAGKGPKSQQRIRRRLKREAMKRHAAEMVQWERMLKGECLAARDGSYVIAAPAVAERLREVEREAQAAQWSGCLGAGTTLDAFCEAQGKLSEAVPRGNLRWTAREGLTVDPVSVLSWYGASSTLHPYTVPRFGVRHG